MTLMEPQARRWTREEYYRLAEEGWFKGQRVLLLDGEIIQMPAQGHLHVKAVATIARLLESVFGPNRWVRSQAPLNIGPYNEPEPDVAVAPEPMDAYVDHPATALLVVEVSDSSLYLDRRKAALYASAGVPEYWIVDLKGRALEVYRRPEADPASQGQPRYREHQTLTASDSLSPLEAPQAVIQVGSLLD